MLFPDPVRETAGPPRPGRSVWCQLCHVRDRDGLGAVLLRFAQQSTVADDGLLHGLRKVLPFSEPSSLGKGEGTVAADHLDTGMVGEPFGHGRYVPVGQQIHGAPRFDVHQDGGIDMPLAQRELVHPEHSRRVRCRFGQALDRRPATAPRRPPLRDPGGRCQRRPPQRDRRRSPQGDLLPRRRPTRRLPGEVHFTDIEHLEFDL